MWASSDREEPTVMLRLPLGSRRVPSVGKAAALSRQLPELYCSLQTNPTPPQTTRYYKHAGFMESQGSAELNDLYVSGALSCLYVGYDLSHMTSGVLLVTYMMKVSHHLL